MLHHFYGLDHPPLFSHPNNMKALMLIALLTIPTTSQAWFTVRGSAGLMTHDSRDVNNELKTKTVNEIYVHGIYGADAILNPESFPLGLGIRYEAGSVDVTTGNKNQYPKNKASLSVSRLAAIATLRPINKDVFFGAIGTYGLSHTQSLKTTTDSATMDYKGGTATSYTAGVEFGLRPGKIIEMGGELGFEVYDVKGMTDDNSGSTLNMDLHGPYVLLHLGISLGG